MGTTSIRSPGRASRDCRHDQWVREQLADQCMMRAIAPGASSLSRIAVRACSVIVSSGSPWAQAARI